ncbi:hypothetical protein GCM10009801_64120 [Streptomyces albiaxialis]|uniref:Serine/threonine protein kinase n=1 Tax=Streptomyces albiaxialis TaxID=329523 RepID=A0ABP5I7B4_9ACTN
MHGMTTVTGEPRADAPTAPPSYEIHRAPEPPSRPGRRRRALALTAGGLALALLTGLGTYFALGALDDGGKEGGKKEPAAREPVEKEKPDAGGAEAAPEPSASRKGPAPAPGGGLPKEFLGAWQANAEGKEAARRFEIVQGDEGDVVAQVHTVFKGGVCTADAVLRAYDRATGRMTVESQNVQGLPPDTRCTSAGRQTLRPAGDDSLDWRRGKGGADSGRTLDRVSDAARPVPLELLRGEWESDDNPPEGKALMQFEQGRTGTATVDLKVESGGQALCKWRATLGAANGKVLAYSPLDEQKLGNGRKCQDRGDTSFEVRVRSDEEIVVTYLGSEDETRYTRSG